MDDVLYHKKTKTFLMFISPIRDLTREQSTYQLIHTKDPQTGTLEILDESHSTSCANFDLEILNFQNLSTSCTNFDLEILNFQNLICPFGLKHGVYTAAILKDFRIDEIGTDAVPGGGMGEVALINVTQTEYQYKYNGKEYQDELGLNMYAMDFRNYDPALGRFHSMDAFASLAPSHTPYKFGFNNPVFWSDPSGLFESNGLAICPTCPQTPEFDDFINDPDIEYYYNSETKTVSEVEVFEETIMTGKKKNNANYSNSCIVGCHNIGRGFDRIGYSILRKTESEDFIPGGWGAGGGFTHNNKFYRPGIDKLVENDLLEWLSMLRGGFGSASSMSLQAYSDIFILVQMWQVNGSTRSPIEVLGSTNISAQDEIIKFEFRQVIPTEKSRWNLGFAEGLQIIKTNKKDSAKTVQEAIRINDSIIQSQMSK